MAQKKGICEMILVILGWRIVIWLSRKEGNEADDVQLPFDDGDGLTYDGMAPEVFAEKAIWGDDHEW